MTHTDRRLDAELSMEEMSRLIGGNKDYGADRPRVKPIQPLPPDEKPGNGSGYEAET